MSSGNQVERNLYLRRWADLDTEFSSWRPHYQELSTFLLPRSGRFFSQDRNIGNKRHNNIYDSSGTRALRVLGAGLMGGATSPARPWFRLTTPDDKLNQNVNVKLWCSQVTRKMLDIFAKSNTYLTLHSMYEELGAFGTGCSIMMDDFEDGIRHYPMTCGEYRLAQDYRRDVCTVYREFDMQVGPMVTQFGYTNCSYTVQSLFDRGALDAWVTIIHAIEPRTDRDIRYKDSKNMAWKSCYFEKAQDTNKYLQETGFKRFPGLCPRWSVSGGDIYGNGPGMETLGDTKQLQHEQLRKAEAIDYQTKPPIGVPTSMKNREVDRLPGGVSYLDMQPGSKVQSLWDVNLRLDFLLDDIKDVRGRIRECFYTDMFLMLSNDTDSRKTATEVAELHEEKLLMIGPVLERLHNELLNPLVENTFIRMLESGLVPQPPQELQGMDLNVEFVSVLAQAQRAINTNGIDRFVGNLGQIALQQKELGASDTVADKFDADKWADVYSDMLGVDPELIIGDDKVALVRNSRAQAAAKQQQLAAAEQASNTAKNLGATPTTGGNAASDIMNQFAQ